MKKITGVLVALLFMVVLASPGFAAKQKVTLNDTGTTSTEVVFPYWEPSRTTMVTGYSVTSDKSGAVLDIYERSAVAYPITGSNTVSGTKVVKTANTAPFTAERYVALVKDSTKAVQWNKISSKTDGVSLNMYNNTSSALGVGDMIIELQKVAAIPVSAATVSASGNALGLLYATPPLFAILDGTAACSINYLTTKTE